MTDNQEQAWLEQRQYEEHQESEALEEYLQECALMDYCKELQTENARLKKEVEALRWNKLSEVKPPTLAHGRCKRYLCAYWDSRNNEWLSGEYDWLFGEFYRSTGTE